MQVTHKISRTKAGMLGGTAFSVYVRVTLSADEKAVLDEFGASTSFEIDGERFSDVKGANHGFMRLDGFTSGTEFKLPGGVSKPCWFALCSDVSVRYAEAPRPQGDLPCPASIRPNSAAYLPA